MKAKFTRFLSFFRNLFSRMHVAIRLRIHEKKSVKDIEFKSGHEEPDGKEVTYDK